MDAWADSKGIEIVPPEEEDEGEEESEKKEKPKALKKPEKPKETERTPEDQHWSERPIFRRKAAEE
jgi:hypothetical protein